MSSPSTSSPEGGAYWRGIRAQVKAVLEIEKWCVTYPGIPRKVQTAKLRLPSTYIHIHFDFGKVVVCRDNTNECLRASFGTSIAVVDGESAAL